MIGRIGERLGATGGVVVLFVGLVLPQAMLGLPVAAAAVGPLPTLGILVAVGAVMALAAAGEAEAIVRDREFRKGGQYFGKLVERYLGVRSAAIPDALAGLRTSMSVLASYVGISVTLAALTGLPRVAWGAITFAGVTIMLLKGGLRIPAAVGASLGIACLPLLAALAVIAVTKGGGGFETPGSVTGADVGLVGGVIVMLYISNVYVVSIARENLPSAPDGRALIRGSAIGTLILTVIAGLWLLACSAALDPRELAGETGTVLGPLADHTGAAATVLGVALTLLLLGLGIERTSVAVMHLVSERLPEGRQALGALAPLAVCLLGEGLLWADAVSFSAIFGVAGVATNFLLAVAVPAMLVLAARRTGDSPAGARVPLLGRPGVVTAVVGGAAVVLGLYATVLASSPLTRVGAVVALAALAATTWLAVRDRAFQRAAAAG